jgi:DUF1016 N-terminal domain
MTQLASHRELELFKRVAEIIESARGRVARSVNSAMVQAYWLIGREIVEIEQQGKKRAGYGDRIIQGLAAKLTAEFGSGYSIRSLRRIRQFYLTYRSGSAVPTALGGPEKRPTALAESPNRGPAKKRPTVLAESTRVAEWLFPASLGYGNDSVQNGPFDFERASRGLEASWRSRCPGVRDFRLRNTSAVAFLDFCGSRAGRGWRRVGKTRTQTGTTAIR